MTRGDGRSEDDAIGLPVLCQFVRHRCLSILCLLACSLAGLHHRWGWCQRGGFPGWKSLRTGGSATDHRRNGPSLPCRTAATILALVACGKSPDARLARDEDQVGPPDEEANVHHAGDQGEARLERA